MTNPNIYNQLDFVASAGTWYGRLWKVLCTGVDVSNVDRIFDNIAFIVFNYDRCVEQFLYEATKTYYNLSEHKAAEILTRLKIYHPYGLVGEFPVGNGIPGIKFGQITGDQGLLNIAGKIRTFTERVDEGTELESIRDMVSEAEKLVFLGFAFHEINMALLKVTKSSNTKAVFGTRLGLSDSDANIIVRRIQGMLRQSWGESKGLSMGQAGKQGSEVNQVNMRMLNGKCADLFSEYSLSIGN